MDLLRHGIALLPVELTQPTPYAAMCPIWRIIRIRPLVYERGGRSSGAGKKSSPANPKARRTQQETPTNNQHPQHERVQTNSNVLRPGCGAPARAYPWRGG